MSNFKIRVVLEGAIKYRFGKKWKKRYCIMALSPDNSDAMHLYVTKCYDDFAPYRNDGCLSSTNLPSVRNSCDLLIQFNHDNDHSACAKHEGRTLSDDSRLDFTGPLINSASLSCNRAAESTSLGLSLASSLASRMNAPAPVDEITGFESGYHMDRESNIIVLTGTSSVHVIALPATDEMFHWADTMSQVMTDCRFRVTLRKSANGGKLPQGIQGSLHVQRWRLCFIGEPSAGCRFICCWRLDSVEKAYTMTLPIHQSPVNQTFDILTSKKSLGPDSFHRISLGSTTSVSNPVRPKHVFILEAKSTAGKGRGTNTFELDGGSLNELITVIDQFMARRFCPDRDTRNLPTIGSSSGSVHMVSSQLSSFISKSSRPSLASSPGTSDGCYSLSPVQYVAAHLRSAGSSSAKSNPLTMPINYESQACARPSQLPDHVAPCGKSVPSFLSNSFTNSSYGYSNLTSSISSFSPSNHMLDTSRRCYISLAKFGSSQTSERPILKSYSYPQRSIGASMNGDKYPQAYISTNEEDARLFPPSVLKHYDTNCSDPYGTYSSYGVTLTPPNMNISAHDIPPTQRSRNLLLFDKSTNSLRNFHDAWGETEDMLSIKEETQVARVPAGLVISKRPSSSNKTLLTSSTFPEHTANTFSGATFSVNSTHTPPVQDNVKDCAAKGRMVNLHRPYRYRKRCTRSYLPNHFDKGLLFSNTTCPTEQQTPSRIRPDCFPGGWTHQGVFTADEDLVDAELTSTNFQNPQVHQRTKQNSSKSSQEAQSTQLVSPVLLANGFCSWCCHLDTDHFCQLDHRIYRHRCQQYRMCTCTSRLGRSLSSTVLSSLSFLPVSASYNPLPCSAPANMVCANHPANNSDAPILLHTSALDFASSSCTTKTLCSDRWKPIRRLFHRKHSRSHDGLLPHDHPPQNPDLPDKHPVSSSTIDSSLTLAPRPIELLPVTHSHPTHKHCPCDLDHLAFLEHWHTAISMRGDRLLAIFCPRHGSRCYHPWFFQRFLNLSSHPHTHRERQFSSHTVATIKPSRLCVCHKVDPAPSTVAVFSTLSAIKNLVSSKQKARNKFIFGRMSATRPKMTSVIKDTCRTSIRDPSHPVELNQTHTAVSSTMDPIDSFRVTDIASDLRTPSSRNPHFTYSFCSSHFPSCGCRSQSVLSLTSLPCSEPAISRSSSSYFGPMLEPGTRSFCSSVSSLLTFHSMSGSSSMLSTCAAGESSTKQSAPVPSTPRTEAVNISMQHCADNLGDAGELPVCDIREMSSASASVYDVVGSSRRKHIIDNYSLDLTGNLCVDCSVSKHPPLCDTHYHRRPNCNSPLSTSVTRRISAVDPPSFIVDTPRVNSQHLSSMSKDSSIPPRIHSRVPLGETLDSAHCCHTHVHAFHRPYQLSSNSQRAHTLPNTNAFRSESIPLAVPSCREHAIGDASLLCHPKTPSGDSSRVSRQHGCTFTRLLPRFPRKARDSNLRHNTSIGVYMSPTLSQLDRKLSCKSACSVIASSFENDTDLLLDNCPRELECTNYCNILSTQSSTVSNDLNCEHQETNKCEKQTAFATHPSENHLAVEKVDLSQSIYVNLPLSGADSVGHFNSCGSRSGRLLQHVLSAVHHHSVAPPASFCLNSKVIALQIPGSSSLVGVLESCPHNQALSKSGPSSKPSNQTICVHVPSSVSQNSDATASTSPRLSNVGMPINFDFTEIPAEVRDPSRNYAMVDLRPSPAGSANANTELAIGVSQNRQSIPPDGVTSADSSASSSVGFSNSASTGSDCASDAATLTSDTMGSCAPVCSPKEISIHRGQTALFTRAATPLKATRRRHSLSLANIDAPILNYVHVMASTSPLTNCDSLRLDDGSTVSDPIGCPLPEHHADSLSSSSGLGGIASQSITPPLAATSSASFGDVFACHSMTSSATSGEGNSVDLGFHSYSPPEHDSVAYTQIDFARTLALGEIRGELEQQDNAVNGKTYISPLSGFPTTPTKVDRSISMRKTLSRPIRSIRRGNQKKSSSFLS